MCQPTLNKPWQSWKTPTDALLWAQSELPAHSPDWIHKQWEALKTDKNGKKAHLWVEFVLDIKHNEFADRPRQD
ncbi:MAG: hypothetical protein SAK29_15215 [Scytonema sp. PMC 1069.18]|nr:hypothetical protein [Scytonema sp. PMC 1069.18]MEC4883741.1 hypothetical protein [Scytonema sp. PMC 1070.18]